MSDEPEQKQGRRLVEQKPVKTSVILLLAVPRPHFLFCVVFLALFVALSVIHIFRVATVRESYLENEIFSRSGKSQGILWMAKKI